MTVHDQPLLIALVAVQFLVHGLGWSMAARLSGGLREAEGQFAMFWLLLASGLMLYVPAWPSGHAMRNLGDVMIIGSLALQHRGLARFWGQAPSDRGCIAWLALAAVVIVASLSQPQGHAWRVATVCVGVAALLLATAWLIWRHGRPATPSFAPLLAATYALLAVALLARALQVLSQAGPAKLSIDAPGRSSLVLVILVMFVGGAINLAQIRLVLGRVLQRLRAQAQSDALTGTANRRGLLDRLEAMHTKAQRSGPVERSYSVLMIDVDHFKRINDSLGHAGGDRALQRVAQALREGLREGDLIARWGGEEFCVLLPRTTLADAQTLAERLAQRVAASGEPPITVSIGVAEARVTQEGAEDVIRRADAALYLAKQQGRNRVVSSAAATTVRAAD